MHQTLGYLYHPPHESIKQSTFTVTFFLCTTTMVVQSFNLLCFNFRKHYCHVSNLSDGKISVLTPEDYRQCSISSSLSTAIYLHTMILFNKNLHNKRFRDLQRHREEIVVLSVKATVCFKTVKLMPRFAIIFIVINSSTFVKTWKNNNTANTGKSISTMYDNITFIFFIHLSLFKAMSCLEISIITCIYVSSLKKSCFPHNITVQYIFLCNSVLTLARPFNVPLEKQSSS